ETRVIEAFRTWIEASVTSPRATTRRLRRMRSESIGGARGYYECILERSSDRGGAGHARHRREPLLRHVDRGERVAACRRRDAREGAPGDLGARGAAPDR